MNMNMKPMCTSSFEQMEVYLTWDGFITTLEKWSSRQFLVANDGFDFSLNWASREHVAPRFTKVTELFVCEVRGSLNKFPDFFRMGTFIDSTYMPLARFE